MIKMNGNEVQIPDLYKMTIYGNNPEYLMFNYVYNPIKNPLDYDFYLRGRLKLSGLKLKTQNILNQLQELQITEKNICMHDDFSLSGRLNLSGLKLKAQNILNQLQELQITEKNIRKEIQKQAENMNGTLQAQARLSLKARTMRS